MWTTRTGPGTAADDSPAGPHTGVAQDAVTGPGEAPEQPSGAPRESAWEGRVDGTLELG